VPLQLPGPGQLISIDTAPVADVVSAFGVETVQGRCCEQLPFTQNQSGGQQDPPQMSSLGQSQVPPPTDPRHVFPGPQLSLQVAVAGS
jgi:hypothetical protein